MKVDPYFGARLDQHAAELGQARAEARRVGVEWNHVIGVIRKDYKPDTAKFRAWRDRVGTNRPIPASDAAREAFGTLPRFTRDFLVASAPWDLKLPDSIAVVMEFHGAIDAEGMTRLGAEIYWLCWRKRNDLREAKISEAFCRSVEALASA